MFMDMRINWSAEPHQYQYLLKNNNFFKKIKSSDKKKELEIPEIKKNIASSHCKQFL